MACLVAYNTDADGTVTPRSTFRGFTDFSFGQKKRPSPIATAWVVAVLRAYGALVDDVRAVDIASLPSSKGGSGVAVQPRG